MTPVVWAYLAGMWGTALGLWWTQKHDWGTHFIVLAIVSLFIVFGALALQ